MANFMSVWLDNEWADIGYTLFQDVSVRVFLNEISIWHDDHHRFSFRLLVLLLPSHHHFFFLWFSLVESLSLSNSLQPCRLHHPRLPCTSSAPGACSNMSIKSVMPPTISSSVVHFSSHLQSCPASGSFPVSQLFASGGQRIGVSASALVLPMNVQDWSPLRLTYLISLHPRDSQESSPIPQFKNINSSVLGLPYGQTLTSTNDYWKNNSFD